MNGLCEQATKTMTLIMYVLTSGVVTGQNKMLNTLRVSVSRVKQNNE